MLIILITPWEPSLYNVFVDTLEFLVTELICIVLYKYHDSIEESKKTILNYQIQVIALSYGGIYFSNLIKILPFNLFPSISIQLLQSYPSIICFILQGELIHWTFLVNLVISIVLHSGFRTFPNSFLDFNENSLRKIILIINVICLISSINDLWIKYGELVKICSKVSIFQLQNKLSLDVGTNILVHK